MLAVTAKPRDNPRTHAREPRSALPLDVRRTANLIVSPLRSPTLQRMEHCACGGDCPRCRERQQAEAPTIQPKLAISAPGDEYEQEADRLADHVMRLTEADGTAKPTPGAYPSVSLLQRKTAGPLRFQNCSLEQQAEIRKHVDEGRVWARGAARLMRRYLNNPEEPSLRPVKNALVKHFRLDEVPGWQKQERLLEILRGFEETVAGFSNPPFKCETKCDKREHAYVNIIIRSLSDIHICLYFFEKVDQTRRTVDIIHEVAHKYADKDDMKVRVVDRKGDRSLVAYEFNQSAYDGLSANEAVQNADCYAVFARDVH